MKFFPCLVALLQQLLKPGGNLCCTSDRNSKLTDPHALIPQYKECQYCQIMRPNKLWPILLPVDEDLTLWVTRTTQISPTVQNSLGTVLITANSVYSAISRSQTKKSTRNFRAFGVDTFHLEPIGSFGKMRQTRNQSKTWSDTQRHFSTQFWEEVSRTQTNHVQISI